MRFWGMLKSLFVLGIQTSQDARFYAISRRFDKTMPSNEDKPLVVQFQAKHEQNIDCGGGYVKVMAEDADLTDFHGDTPYFVMFGKYLLCLYSNL